MNMHEASANVERACVSRDVFPSRLVVDGDEASAVEVVIKQ